MRAILKATWRVTPPFLVALLYVDLFTSSFVARMGVSSTGQADPRALPPEEVKKLVSLSDFRFNKGEYRGALQPALKLYNSYPENPVYLQRLADIHNRLGQYKEEAAMWEQFLQYAPVPVEGCPQIGKAYQKQGKRTEAIHAFERCLAFDTTEPDSLFFLAHALEMEQQFDRAEKLYQQCVSVSAKYSDCQLGVARVLFRQGHGAQAREIAEEVLARSPTNTDALLVMALVNWSQGNLAEARRILERAVKLSDRYADLYVVLGRIAERQGDRSLARASYEHVFELDPDNVEIPRHWLPTAGKP
jgi:tetratricopeptide (TPR) repeat protein